ncbi:MAG: cysteine desulfurase family protein [Flavobacteriales bacterium]
MIYLDHHATTPVDERVFEEMKPYFMDEFGNAASNDHDAGRRAKQAVDNSRQQIAELINAEKDDVIFTSGATESNNISLLGVARAYEDEGNHIVTTNVEHNAVLDPCEKLEEDGFDVTYLPVNEDGLIEPKQVVQAIRDDTILVSVMTANNEIGTLMPIDEIGSITSEHGVVFHTDAAQATGYIPLDVEEMNIDLMSMSAHKMYGPKGIGALYVRRVNPRIDLEPIIYGGGHERGLRSGTLNVPSIVGFGKAAEITSNNLKERSLELQEMRDWFWEEVQERLDEVELNGHPEKRLPHNLNIFIRGVEAQSLIVKLDDIALSTGSACTSAKVEPSHVLMALGFGEKRAHQSIRFGLGKNNTKEELKKALGRLDESITRLSKLSPT